MECPYGAEISQILQIWQDRIKVFEDLNDLKDFSAKQTKKEVPLGAVKLGTSKNTKETNSLHGKAAKPSANPRR